MSISLNYRPPKPVRRQSSTIGGAAGQMYHGICMFLLICLLLTISSANLAQQSPDASRFTRSSTGATRADERLRLAIIGSTISGVVVNSQGAPVSGATVVAKNLQNGTETRTQANDKGSFSFSALPAATYSLITTAPNFLRDERKLEVSQAISPPPLRIELKDGSPRTMMPSLRLPAMAPGTPPDLVLRELRKPPAKPIEKQIDSRLEAASSGEIVFNPPTRMQAETHETVTVRISKSLVKDLTQGMLGGGESQTQPIKVGSEMGVTLKGPEDYFTIARLNSSEKQAITDDDATQWLFDVLPLKAGHSNLILTAYVVLDTPGGAEQHDYPVFAREIDITTAPKPFLPSALSFVGNNWDKLLGALVSTGLLGWIITRLKKKANSKDKGARRGKA